MREGTLHPGRWLYSHTEARPDFGVDRIYYDSSASSTGVCRGPGVGHYIQATYHLILPSLGCSERSFQRSMLGHCKSGAWSRSGFLDICQCRHLPWRKGGPRSEAARRQTPFRIAHQGTAIQKSSLRESIRRVSTNTIVGRATETALSGIYFYLFRPLLRLFRIISHGPALSVTSYQH